MGVSGLSCLLLASLSSLNVLCAFLCSFFITRHAGDGGRTVLAAAFLVVYPACLTAYQGYLSCVLLTAICKAESLTTIRTPS